jgi:hypothetical protein
MPSRCNDKAFQNKVIDFNGERLGIDAYASFEGNQAKNTIKFCIERSSIAF